MAKASRPSFKEAWAAFLEVRMSVADVGKKIGGRVQMNTNSGVFANACPIRMSYVLNRTGFPIGNVGNRYAISSGADKLRYLYRVKDMLEYLGEVFGAPDKTVKSPSPKDFAGMKGIIVVKGHGWGDASGHVTLWNGSECSDTCHLMEDPDNGRFVPEVASIWILQ